MTLRSDNSLQAERADALGHIEDVIIRSGLRRLVPGPIKALYRRYRTRRGVPLRIQGYDVLFRAGTQPIFGASPDDDVGTADVEALHFFASHTRPGAWVADVGAFMGTYTLVAAAIAGPDGRVFAFEPTEDSRAELQDNVRLNNWQDRVDIVPMAVGQEVGEIEFFTAGGTPSTNSLFASAVQGSSTLHRVPMTTLDTYFGELGRLPDVLKIDVEGAELHVLRGAEAVLASNAHIVCELHPYAWQAAGHDFAEFRAIVEKHGRRIIQLTTGAAVTSPRYGPVGLIR